MAVRGSLNFPPEHAKTLYHTRRCQGTRWPLHCTADVPQPHGCQAHRSLSRGVSGTDRHKSWCELLRDNPPRVIRLVAAGSSYSEHEAARSCPPSRIGMPPDREASYEARDCNPGRCPPGHCKAQEEVLHQQPSTARVQVENTIGTILRGARDAGDGALRRHAGCQAKGAGVIGGPRLQACCALSSCPSQPAVPTVSTLARGPSCSRTMAIGRPTRRKCIAPAHQRRRCLLFPTGAVTRGCRIGCIRMDQARAPLAQVALEALGALQGLLGAVLLPHGPSFWQPGGRPCAPARHRPASGTAPGPRQPSHTCSASGRAGPPCAWAGAGRVIRPGRPGLARGAWGAPCSAAPRRPPPLRPLPAGAAPTTLSATPAAVPLSTPLLLAGPHP